MSKPETLKADDSGARPIYTGMDWRAHGASKATQWVARSEVTPSSYIVQKTDDDRWVARQGFRDSAGRPHIEIGVFASMVIAMTAAERHDFGFWSSVSERSGQTCIFMGSPDHVSDFIENLAEYEREDILDTIAGGYKLPDGTSFMQSASFFQAIKAGLKQEKNGNYTATLTIDQADLPMWLIQSKPGAQMAVGIAGIAEDDPEEWGRRSKEAFKRSFALPQDNAFHAWIMTRYDRWGLVASAMQQTSEEVEAAVSETLRRLIGCPSRRDLGTNRDAIMRLERIDREFYLDMSRGYAVNGG